MRFTHPNVISYLSNNKIVATMRNYYYPKYGRIKVKIKERICDGLVLDIVPNNKENRMKWVKYSGFKSVAEWLSEAIKLHKKRFPRWIVVVQIECKEPDYDYKK